MPADRVTPPDGMMVPQLYHMCIFPHAPCTHVCLYATCHLAAFAPPCRATAAPFVRVTVNNAGSYYVLSSSGSPAAVTCPEDTFSPGTHKQRACVPCPAGMGTNGQIGATAPSACSE